MSEGETAAREAAECVAALAKRLIENVETVVIGKRQVITEAVVALLSEGHILIEDVPGVAKTVLARALARSMGGTFHRIQCTPDLLPSDVTGSSVFNQRTLEFEFWPGPAFGNVLLADELNRATPRTQSALLECMAESQITVDGQTRALQRPFLVFATQNPIEYEGTFPLPEAQLDRFAIRMRIGYPDEAAEIAMLERLRVRHPVDDLPAVVSVDEVRRAQACVKAIYVHEEVRQYIVRLVRATRAHADLALGASPRASLALFRTSQAVAAINGWAYVIPDFVKTMARLVLDHRTILKPEARLRRQASADVTSTILARVPPPTPKAPT